MGFFKPCLKLKSETAVASDFLVSPRSETLNRKLSMYVLTGVTLWFMGKHTR